MEIIHTLSSSTGIEYPLSGVYNLNIEFAQKISNLKYVKDFDLKNISTFFSIKKC